MAAHLDDGGRGERLRASLVIAVIGPPNVGKSSLVNLLAQRDVAIVTPLAGTTRDVIEVQLDLGGLPVTLLDTAGLRDAGDPIEAEGIARARRRAETADLRLYLVDASAQHNQVEADDATLVVVNKLDRRPSYQVPSDAVGISCQTGAGINQLIAVLTERASRLLVTSEAPMLTRARHRQAVTEAHDALARFEAAVAGGDELALMAEDIRLATRAIGRITGDVGVEEVLDRIFSTFCIGK
jgi:tRNA modification GTPase